MRQDQQKRKEPPRYDGLCRRLSTQEARARADRGEAHVVRFRTPREGATTASDLLRGDITVHNADIDDYVLLKSDGLPVYHLAAMVDDHLMGITHVLRSSEWLPTFPLHALVVRAFGWPEPIWVHLSVFLNPTGKGKMSKRQAIDTKGGAKSIYTLDLRDLGYLPEAVVNWLALMGWSYDDRTELFAMDDLVAKFTLDKLNPSPAAVNFTKLDHFNGVYMRALSNEDLARRLEPFFRQAGLAADSRALTRLAPILRDRIRTLEEAVEIAGFFFRTDVEPPDDQRIGRGLTRDSSRQALAAAAARIEAMRADEWPDLEKDLRSLADQLGLDAGQLFGLMRLAITGQPVSPPLFDTMAIIGRDTVLARLRRAVERLAGN
jgi:glutamyl-tRNA synthetase